MSEIKLQVRYQRHATDEGVEYAEPNFERAFLDWTMKSEEIALVMVDCWNIHPIVTHQERAERICSERIAPLAQACRDDYPGFMRYILFVLCEVAITACDLAEVLGSALGLNLLFGLPETSGLTHVPVLP